MPFEWHDTMQYIQHRLNTAGKQGRFQFPHRAMMLAHYITGGVPRRINQLCDRALLAAYANHRFDVNAFMLWRAKREIAGMN